MATKEEMLEGENRAMRAELVELRTRCTSLDGQFEELRQAVEALEAHAGALENLFVATSRLHGAADLQEAMRVVADILRDLVGAKRFAVYLNGESGEPIAVLEDENGGAPPATSPALASVDLALGERNVGSVRIFELLAQKPALTPLDHELLGLLGRQAAPALLAARNMAMRSPPALEEFVRFLVEKRR